ncbi:MAG: dimethyl sulfoxide reductase anchor subunit, partial [Nitrospinae bacterium]|nr:dimethyl sulfoxide reductase anchor subunit [Nitrospinota bacterium]
MRPEWSIIILTVLAGVGQGIFFFLVGFDLVSPLADRGVNPWQVAAACALAAAFGGAGAGASFLHLHNKQRAAKAFAQWRFSWLSREALLLPVFLGAVVMYGGLTLIGVTGVVRTVVGVTGVASGIALSVAQGMIYAVVKSIREWATPYTPLNFVLLGLATGAVALGATFQIVGAPSAVILTTVRAAIGFTAVAFAVKALTFRFNDTAWRSTSLRTATGFRSDEIMLTDTGCSYAHYNTKEYFDAAAKKEIGAMRWGVAVAHFL